MLLDQLKPNIIVRGPIFPEPVQVNRCQTFRGLQMPCHEDSRHDWRRSGHPGRGCRPEHRPKIILAIIYLTNSYD
jgi:hypothetical protein